MIRTTYFSGLGTEFQPGATDLVVGVVRRPMDFVDEVVDRNEPTLGPPEDLLDAYNAVVEAAERHGQPHPRELAWRSVNFEPRFRGHLERRRPRRSLEELRDDHREQAGDVVLVCWERDVRFCHRGPLADVLVAGLNGISVAHHPTPETVAAEAAQVTENTDEGPRDVPLMEFDEAVAGPVGDSGEGSP